ncbi:Rab3 GTPase-activating protein catalytic subunit [Mortierella polycephala]|uniref:Rab3 GTPase-activating protein catalytic subunit n=1 Tax=Mortierella polycephala TaxID=41804 RepID=A0A9P6QGD5_9FUNG|nr:Rab3 GTPase-activating protein catalytic subunit [Mortierella polycephala]
MDDFENFEFIDYTTSGPWERFITQIEDSLRTWGLTDRSLGVFDPDAIASTEAAAAAVSQTSSRINPVNRDAGGDLDNGSHGHAYDHTTGEEKSPVYQLKEMLSLDDATYALSYQYHPAKARLAAGAERIDLDFLPITLEGTQHHCLHRWTSLTHILVLSPVTISDIFASTSSSSASSAIIDISSAKLLISSFAIAFQNTGCSVPVFVPTGQPWNLTFTGLMIQSKPPPGIKDTRSGESAEGFDLLEEEDDTGVEIRFNTVLIPYPPVQYTHLLGIMDFFVERMGIEAGDLESTPGNYSQELRERVFVSALFSYDLMNWHDEDWRRWREPIETELDQSGIKDNGYDRVSQVNAEPSLGIPDVGMDLDDIKNEGRALSTLPIPILPFGPTQDPLRSMRLFSRFASAPSTIYLDNGNFTNMDASHANIWILRAAFKEDDYGNSRGCNLVVEHRSGGARLIQGTITMVDAVDVENIVDALFETSSSPISSTEPISRLGGLSSGNIRLVPASVLGLHFKHATMIPYNSFLWRMIQYLVDVISPNSDISYATSIMGFMKVLWSELLKQLYIRWENSQLIPFVDIYGEGLSNYLACATEDQDLEKKPVAIDLRYNLLHQKLSMLNCCIARQIIRNREAPEHVHPVQRHRKNLSTTGNQPKPERPRSSSPTSEQTYGAQFQNLLHGISDISRPRSADVVPMAKRLLETVKNRGVSSQQDVSSLSSTGSSVSESISITDPSLYTASLPISKKESFRIRQRSRSQFSQHHRRHPTETTFDSDDDEDVFYDPMETSESVLDASEVQRRSQSLAESFVALKYSSSVDSQSGILISDIDQSTVNARAPDPREVADESKSEGSVKPLKDLRLLETDAPLMIPKLQEPGYMTEDMIQQQEELFETLGSSSDGAKMRAKMQSTQLISDMEAFKAANPGCVLGDFIRWHSPKDWVEDKRQMSARMADAGNYWQELWANSKRIPVSRQTPLFNHNQEAAKALFYLDSISADQLFVQLFPTMCLLAYDTLVSHPVALHIRQVAQNLKELAQELTGFPWNELTGEEDLNLDVIMDKFREVELQMGRAIALVRKFPEQYSLVERILEDQETVVEDGAERECVYDIFSIGGSLQSSFPRPTSREFVLETFDPAPTEIITTGWDSRPLQRRMYACFKESELRIVEAIAKDGMYM